jgi:uncharacterized protein YndB with AHSA1/START domain
MTQDQHSISEWEIISTRVFDVSRDLMFKAWSDPVHLARWWGPRGFRNSFELFEFRPGGEWRSTMHSPEGNNYQHLCRFVSLEPPARIVFDHLSGPSYRVTVTLTEQCHQTRVRFRMLFDSEEECAGMKAYALEANEECFDRLAAELATMH